MRVKSRQGSEKGRATLGAPVLVIDTREQEPAGLQEFVGLLYDGSPEPGT
jgi:hypothetical protein